MRERALYKISVQFLLLLGANIYSCEKTDEESICTDLGPNQVQFILFSRNFWQTQYVSFESYKTDLDQGLMVDRRIGPKAMMWV